MVLALLVGCLASTAPLSEELAPGGSRLVAGVAVAPLTRDGEVWSCGRCRITTPLPDGYPAPTAPGAIELKSYPVVRKAEATAVFGPELGRNLAFWKLFQHIERSSIAMTAPVEMRFEREKEDAKKLAGWTMSFLYREPTMGKLGADGNVAVVEDQPLVVLSIGIQGDYSTERALAEAEALRDVAAKLEGYKVAGEPRALYYNGPDASAADRWAEIQLPLERVAADAKPAPAPQAAPGAAAPGEKGAAPRPKRRRSI